MRNGQFETLKQATAHLRGILRASTTSSVVAWASSEILRVTIGGNLQGLVSPYKQCLHLLGLMLATAPQAGARDLSEGDWKLVIRDLNTIFELYAAMYFPDPDAGDEQLTEQWIRVRDVALPLMMRHVNLPRFAYDYQDRERVDAWYGPFSETIRAMIGLTVEELRGIATWVEQEFQRNIQKVNDARESERQSRLALLDRAAQAGWSLREMREHAKSDPASENTRKLFAMMDAVRVIELDNARSVFGRDQVDKFVSLFSATRGDAGEYLYPTDTSPAEIFPLFRRDENSVWLPAPQAVMSAVEARLWKEMRGSAAANAFLRNRDQCVEDKVAAIFKSFAPAEARILRSVCEDPKGQNEHDLVVECGGDWLIIEVKATAPKEPFRDPEKAFTRARGDFRSDGGIQKAYEQGERLRQLLVSDQPTTLYGGDGSPLLSVPKPVQSVQLLCVTAETFGMLGVDLSLLLEKAPEASYPWAVSVSELEVILEAFQRLGKGWDEFLIFLRQRSLLHGRIFASDELDVTGYYIERGDFPETATQEGAISIFDSESSHIFDRLQLEKKGIEVPERPSSRLDVRDAREQFGRALAEMKAREAAWRGGRNDPCWCESGLKFKKCHGR